MVITYKNINIYVENPFFLKGKTTGQISNNFTIIKSITIIFCECLTTKEKSFLFFFALSHTLIISLKGGNPFSLFNMRLLVPFFFFLFSVCSTPKTNTYNPYLNNPSRHTILVLHKYKIHLN